MRPADVLASQFDFFYQSVEANAGDLTAEQSVHQPEPGGNCANWILGHLVGVQNGVMSLIGEAPVWEADQLERAGFDPITGPDEAIDWDTMRSRLSDSRERCLAGLRGLSDEDLAAEVPDPFGGTSTRAAVLGILSFHQAYHVGQLGLSRRLVGLEGAIRGPGQEQAVA